MPTLLAHICFFTITKTNQKKAKESASQHTLTEQQFSANLTRNYFGRTEGQLITAVAVALILPLNNGNLNIFRFGSKIGFLDAI